MAPVSKHDHGYWIKFRATFSVGSAQNYNYATTLCGLTIYDTRMGGPP